MSTNAKQTIVEEGTEFRGTLVSTCPIVVRGRIEGDIDTPSLAVSEKGAVHGKVKVGTIRSAGELSGEFDADSVELAGRVKDNTIIRAKSLEVKLSTEETKMQVTFGDCELAVGEEPRDDGGKRVSQAPSISSSTPAVLPGAGAPTTAARPASDGSEPVAS
jgi:cytoskeletal protein CcmA (bactofilin family)